MVASKEQSMAKDKMESWETEMIRIARLLGERDDTMNKEEVRHALESAGIDPARVTARFHERALRLAEDLHREGRMVPLALKQAIAQTEPSAARSRPGWPET